MKVVFITDGGLEMGMGHIYRSLTLAKEIEDFRAKIERYFLTKSDEIAVSKIKNSGFTTLKLKNDEEITNQLEKINPSIIIIDRLNLKEFFVKKLRDKLNAKIVIFGNLSLANRYADIVINAIVGSNFKNRKYLDKSTNTLYFYGPKYLVLRKEFYEFKKKKHKKLNDRVETILLIFGGSDASNLTSKVLDKLLGLEEGLKVDILLGAHFMYFDELNQILEKYQNKKGNVKIYKDTKNVAELMHKADLVITSPGLSMFEAFCTGSPVIGIRESSLHKNAFKGFINTFDKNEINKNKFEDIISNVKTFNKYKEYSKKLEIGEGKTELIKEIIGSDKR